MSVLRRNNVHIRGTGDRAIVFSHGFGCDQSVWRHVAPSFERDFVTILFDHVGSGESQPSAYSSGRYGTLEAYAADLAEIGRELELKHAVIVGHCSGAMIGALACANDPDLCGHLVMLTPSARYVDDADAYSGGFGDDQVDTMLGQVDADFEQWSARMAPLFSGNSERPELAEELLESFRRLDPAVAKDLARAVFRSDLREVLPRVTARSLIVSCREDWIAPLTANQFVHRQISGSRLVGMHARGHLPHLSAPSDTVTTISDFLREAQPSPASAGLASRGAARAELLRQSTRLLGATQITGYDLRAQRDDLMESLLARHGELWLHLGRYDMYALTVQDLLMDRMPAADESPYIMRTRGERLLELLGHLSTELREHFRETLQELEGVLDRHRISAQRGAAIPGIRSARVESDRIRPSTRRDWFDQSNVSTADLQSSLEVVERDIVKMVSLCFRMSHVALATQRLLAFPGGAAVEAPRA